jgi:hypothetical protein
MRLCLVKALGRTYIYVGELTSMLVNFHLCWQTYIYAGIR